MIRALVLAVAGWLLADPGTAACRQALALGLDVSGSVDAREYRLQIDGLAQALDDPEVRRKLMAMPEAPVRLMVYEWSGPNDQAVLVPWSEIANPAALDGVIETLRQTARRQSTPGTALGQAMAVGAMHLASQESCWKRTLDLSGDGKSNLGPRPKEARRALEDSGITINGLVVGVDDPSIGDIRQSEISELSAYYRSEVIMGPDAFVETALGFADYARAMQRKLIRELDGLVFSRVDVPALPPTPRDQ